MDAYRKGREQTLTALLICPDREISESLQAAVNEARAFQILAELRAYPSPSTLEIRLKQLRPDVVLIDVASGADTAGELVKFVAAFQPATHAVGLHRVNDSAAVVAVLRAGGAEFLHAPFDPNTQREAAARLRRLRVPVQEADSPAYGKIVVFTSAKPGAGSSTLATHLAHGIRKATGRRVLLADLDLEGGTIAFYLKLQAAYSMVDALEQSDRLEPSAWPALTVPAGGLDVLAAPEQPFSRPVEPGRLHDVLESARSVYDWIVIDVPSVFHRVTLLTLSESDQAYLISTSDLASLHLTRRAIALLTQLGFAKERYEVIVNRLSKKDGIGGSDIEKIFNCPVHATLPNDYFSLHRVLSLGQTLAPDCELGKSIGHLAARISGLIPSEKKAPTGVTEVRPALSQT